MRRFIHPTSLIGYGTLILTLIIFFAQGGFGKMTPLTSLYIIGLVISAGLISWGIYKSIPFKEIKEDSPIHKIVPTLEKMEIRLNKLVDDDLKYRFDILGFIKVNEQINEIINAKLSPISSVDDAKMELAKYEAQVRQTYKVEEGGIDLIEILPNLTLISGVLDNRGWGLKESRINDGVYKKLNKQLRKYRNDVIDEELNGLIRCHIEASEAFANLLLSAKRALSLKTKVDAQDYNVADFMSSESQSNCEHIEGGMKELLTGIRVAVGKRIKELEQTIDDQKQQSVYNLEFNDFSMSTTDGLLLLGVTFYSTNPVIVDDLSLQYNGKTFKPQDWTPFKLQVSHTKNYTFDLNAIKAVVDNSQKAVFVSTVDDIEYKSRSFNLNPLF